ncbi:BZ3500_MvSof-1268-A1-R1_Chr1-3g01914 [Microbotryum saponariae]|uniref:BZ3500_MvSof-1268-A1-R1_Chr1-3g01914 protein n=1 Tax=Microbotryum saponariae TaxID=289078 RepID=A0A2X0KMG4_9BASI|nr:BZ3500_MvSof-1268-A1-R1_Chr1-3g01914 [Microbotryum saponariae]SCZ94889.1 BZ3501_MvSof-1269-A2-R1_Chr1-3g01516 [Microbotryum saponariae]
MRLLSSAPRKLLQSSVRSSARTMTTAAAVPRIPIPVNLEITSDSICPFCFIGYKRITSAIDRATALGLPLDFAISFAPFQLDPTLPKSPGESKKERYVRRFGDKFHQMEAQMKERGKAEGINFSYDGPVSATEDNHRMIMKARELGGEAMQKKYVERVFSSYFEEEKDPGSFDVLADDAEAVGMMTKQEVCVTRRSRRCLGKLQALDFLHSDKLKAEVKLGIQKAQARGISGVPFTIINRQPVHLAVSKRPEFHFISLLPTHRADKLAISGAQETDTFFDVFKRIASGELKP